MSIENLKHELFAAVKKDDIKAIEGLFKLVAKEEKAIRELPSARVTDLLKKVFSE